MRNVEIVVNVLVVLRLAAGSSLTAGDCTADLKFNKDVDYDEFGFVVTEGVTLIKTYSAPSPLKCLKDCCKTESCSTVTFTLQNSQCLHYACDGECPTKDSKGSYVYILHRPTESPESIKTPESTPTTSNAPSTIKTTTQLPTITTSTTSRVTPTTVKFTTKTAISTLLTTTSTPAITTSPSAATTSTQTTITSTPHTTTPTPPSTTTTTTTSAPLTTTSTTMSSPHTEKTSLKSTVSTTTSTPHTTSTPPATTTTSAPLTISSTTMSSPRTEKTSLIKSTVSTTTFPTKVKTTTIHDIPSKVSLPPSKSSKPTDKLPLAQSIHTQASKSSATLKTVPVTVTGPVLNTLTLDDFKGLNSAKTTAVKHLRPIQPLSTNITSEAIPKRERSQGTNTALPDHEQAKSLNDGTTGIPLTFLLFGVLIVVATLYLVTSNIREGFKRYRYQRYNKVQYLIDDVRRDRWYA